jgi:hypothetical protein
MCRVPCWGTPRDFQRLIKAGYARMLSLDSRKTKTGATVRILVPARDGWGGKRVGGGLLTFETKAFSYLGFTVARCGFQDKRTQLCRLHLLNLKPTEGRMAIHDKDLIDRCRHSYFARLWARPFGRRIVAKWQKEIRP